MGSNKDNDYRYINMNEWGMKWYFNDEEISVPKKDMKNIKPLSIKYSGLLWETYVSRRNRHFMLLDTNDKQLLLEKDAYNWLNDWNEGKYENFREYLIETMPYNFKDTIIVFWSKESAIETNWSIFLKHWANFLFDDEGVILINTNNENVLVFCTDGVLLKGKRVGKILDTF
ncbi:hypothetical protein SH2C18_49010 [Clostridium sediminicola]|uniref:DUF2947 family protein n=1 Tax=Clostridium sediminicola TaxID=3114879 RepID=UPI0031F1E5DE